MMLISLTHGHKLCFGLRELWLMWSFLLILINVHSWSSSISNVKDVTVIKWVMKPTLHVNAVSLTCLFVATKDLHLSGEERKQAAGRCAAAGYLWANTGCLFSLGKYRLLYKRTRSGHYPPLKMTHQIDLNVQYTVTVMCHVPLRVIKLQTNFLKCVTAHIISNLALVHSYALSVLQDLYYWRHVGCKERKHAMVGVVILTVPGYWLVFLAEVITQRKLAINAQWASSDVTCS